MNNVSLLKSNQLIILAKFIIQKVINIFLFLFILI